LFIVDLLDFIHKLEENSFNIIISNNNRSNYYVYTYFSNKYNS